MLVLPHKPQTGIAGIIESTGFDKVFHQLFIERTAVNPFDKIFNILERSVGVPFFYNLFYTRRTDSFYARKSKTNLSVFRFEVYSALIDVGRQNLYVFFQTKTDMLFDVVNVGNAVVKRGAKILDGMIKFKIRRLISNVRVRRRMRLVEAVLCKFKHLIEQRVCRFFADAPRQRALYRMNGVVRVAVDKDIALLYHLLHIFLAHGTTDDVRLSERITSQFSKDCHYLFLINHTTVGRLKNRFEQRVQIGNFIGIVLSVDVVAYKLHGTGAVQRYSCQNIFHAVGFQLLHHLLHSAAFQLEHGVGVAVGDKIEHGRIVVSAFAEIDIFSRVFLYLLYRLVNVGQCAQTQKVHFEHAQFFNFVFVKLSSNIRSASLQRNIVGNVLAANNYARGMHARLSGHTLHRHGKVENAF